MNIFKNNVKAKKIIIIGGKSSGTMRKTCIKPLSPDIDSLITGRTLTDSLLINGKYATYNSEFSNEEILDALKKCKLLLKPYRDCDFYHEESEISSRQGFCARAVLLHIVNQRYNAAMHELYDCIDDYENGRIRVVTKNEYILYGCLISCFIEALEHEETNNKNKEIKA